MARTAGALSRGDDAVCVVRPERLAIAPAENTAGMNRLSVRLQRQTYLGNTVDVLGTFSGNGGEVTLQLDPSNTALPALPVDSAVSFSGQDAVIFRAGD